MLDLLNLIFLGTTMLVDIHMFNTTEVVLPPMGQVVQITFREEGYNMFNLSVPPSEDGKCHFTGIAVPYEQTWEEVNGEQVRPPEPGKVAGYALLINQKTCPGKEPEAMFRVSARDVRGVLFNKGKMLKAYPTTSVQLASLREDRIPKWLPQVMTTVARIAETDPIAKAFVEQTKQAEAAARAKVAAASTQAQ